MTAQPKGDKVTSRQPGVPPFDYPRRPGEPWDPGNAAGAVVLQALVDCRAAYLRIEPTNIKLGELRDRAEELVGSELAGASTAMAILGQPPSVPFSPEQYLDLFDQLRRAPDELIFLLRAHWLLGNVYDIIWSADYESHSERMSYILLSLGRMLERLEIHHAPPQIVHMMVRHVLEILRFQDDQETMREPDPQAAHPSDPLTDPLELLRPPEPHTGSGGGDGG